MMTIIGRHQEPSVKPEAQEEDTQPLINLQRAVRRKLLYKDLMFCRANFSKRLIFEEDMVMGTLRLANHILLFWLMVTCLLISSNGPDKLGIHRDLEFAFDFKNLKLISSKEKFFAEGMRNISKKMGPYFPLSSKYFDSGEKGAVQLQGPILRFAEPKVGASLDISASAMSFLAWIKPSPQFLQGYMVRKSPVKAGPGSELCCWGLFLHKERGMELHYGAHDYSSLVEGVVERQYTVGLLNPKPLVANAFALLTMVVTEDKVKFFIDKEFLGERILPRNRLTDCFNGGEGLLLGDTGMEMGMLRYYPFALAKGQIEEIHRYGYLLGEISSGSRPFQPDDDILLGELKSQSNVLASVREDIHARQDLTTLNQVLQKTETSSGIPDTRAPEAPLGNIEVNMTLIRDPLTGKDYTQILRGPWRLSPTFRAEDHRKLRPVPSYQGTGVTFMHWMRDRVCPPGDSCAQYVWAIFNDELPGYRIVFNLWTEKESTLYLSKSTDNGWGHYKYPSKIIPDSYWMNDDLTWRHVAVQLDETDDYIRFFIDGKIAYEEPWGLPVAGEGGDHVDEDNSGDRRITLGYREDGYTFGAENVELYDFRMYAHHQGPLTEEEITKIAYDSTPQDLVPDRLRCLSLDDTRMEDQDWRDIYGHNCEWYREKSAEFPAVCTDPTVAEQCPLSCATRQECWDNEPAPPTFFTWDRIRKIESRSNNGTICLGDELKRDDVVAECQAWVAAGMPDDGSPGLYHWTRSVDSQWRVWPHTKHINITDCDVLAEAIDEDCAMNMSQIRSFTKEVVAKGGDYSFAFWVRPLGSQSMWTNGVFNPTMRWLNSFSPPKQQIYLTKMEQKYMEFQLFSSQKLHYDEYDTKKLKQEGWTFIAVSRENTTVGHTTSVATDFKKHKETNAYDQHFYDQEMMFHSLECNYPILMSPMMLVPAALPHTKMQRLYLSQINQMGVRQGPRLARKEVVQSQQIELTKQDYGLRSVLVAPPLVFQQRSRPAADCTVGYSGRFIGQQHDKVKQFTCSNPFKCDLPILQDPINTFACQTGIETNGTFFQNDIGSFAGKQGFSEFLFALTENDFLYRDGQIRETSTFIDSRTSDTDVILVFFTPDSGITTMLTIHADFAGVPSAKVKVQVQHYEILEGSKMSSYLTVQILVLVNVFFLVVDSFGMIREDIVNRPGGERFQFTHWVKVAIDVGSAIAQVVFISYRIPTKVNSAKNAEELVGSLSAIEWDNRELTFTAKTESFFSLLKDLQEKIETDDSLNLFCVIILLMSLLRLIQSTAVHPRLNLLLGTLQKAADDLWHAILLVALLISCFAAYATWRFGSSTSIFAEFETTVTVQLYMLFGEFPSIISTNYSIKQELQLFILLYIVILFFLVQNFLLAIIVEAYMQYRQEAIEANEIEQSFVIDVWDSFYTFFVAHTQGWPSTARVGRTLDKWPAKFNIGVDDLMRTGLFKDPNQAISFMKHFQRPGFTFLHKVNVKKLDKSELASEVEKSMAFFLEKKAPSIKDMASKQIEFAIERKREKSTSFGPTLASNGSPASKNESPGPLVTEPESSSNSGSTGGGTSQHDVEVSVPRTGHYVSVAAPLIVGEIGRFTPASPNGPGLGAVDPLHTGVA